MKKLKKIGLILLLIPFLSSCNYIDELYSDVSDLRGFYINLNNEDFKDNYIDYSSNENIYLYVNDKYIPDNQESFTINHGIAEIPKLQYSHYYAVENNKYNVLTSNHIELSSTIITSSIESILKNIHFISENDGKYVIDDDYEFSCDSQDNKIIIKIRDTDIVSVRGERVNYGVSMNIHLIKQDKLKNVQIIEFDDNEVMLRTTEINRHQTDLKLIEQTEYYYVKYTYINSDNQEYVVDSKFYSEPQRIELSFMNEFGYVDKDQRFMDIVR